MRCWVSCYIGYRYHGCGRRPEGKVKTPVESFPQACGRGGLFRASVATTSSSRVQRPPRQQTPVSCCLYFLLPFTACLLEPSTSSRILPQNNYCSPNLVPSRPKRSGPAKSHPRSCPPHPRGPSPTPAPSSWPSPLPRPFLGTRPPPPPLPHGKLHRPTHGSSSPAPSSSLWLPINPKPT